MLRRFYILIATACCVLLAVDYIYTLLIFAQNHMYGSH